MATVEERLETLSQIREKLRKINDEIDASIKTLEQFPGPVPKAITGWLRLIRYRLYIIWSGPLSYPHVLEIARRR